MMNFLTMPSYIPPPTIYAPGKRDLVVGANVSIKCELPIFENNVRNIDLHWQFPRRANAVLSPERPQSFRMQIGVGFWQNLTIVGLDEGNAGDYSCYGQVTNHTNRGEEWVHTISPADIWRAGDAIIDDPKFNGKEDGRITVAEEYFRGKPVNWVFSIFAHPDPGKHFMMT